MNRVTDYVTKAYRNFYGVANAIEKNAFSHKPPFEVFHLIFGFKVDFHCVSTFFTPAPNEIGSCWGRTPKSSFTGGFKVSKDYLWFPFLQSHNSSVQTIVFCIGALFIEVYCVSLRSTSLYKGCELCKMRDTNIGNVIV